MSSSLNLRKHNLLIVFEIFIEAESNGCWECQSESESESSPDLHSDQQTSREGCLTLCKSKHPNPSLPLINLLIFIEPQRRWQAHQECTQTWTRFKLRFNECLLPAQAWTGLARSSDKLRSRACQARIRCYGHKWPAAALICDTLTQLNDVWQRGRGRCTLTWPGSVPPLVHESSILGRPKQSR